MVGSTLFTKRNMAFSEGRLILLRIMYMNCATVEREYGKWMGKTESKKEGGKSGEEEEGG